MWANGQGVVSYVGRKNRFIRGVDLLQVCWIQEVLPEIVLQVPEFSEGVLLRRCSIRCAGGGQQTAEGKQRP